MKVVAVVVEIYMIGLRRGYWRMADSDVLVAFEVD